MIIISSLSLTTYPSSAYSYAWVI